MWFNSLGQKNGEKRLNIFKKDLFKHPDFSGDELISMTERAKDGKHLLFMFKVIQSNYMGNVRGHPYRVIAIPGDFTLFKFAYAIISSFEFEEDHAFGFYDNLTRWSNSTEGYELFSDDDRDPTPEFPGVKKTLVKDVFTYIKKKMLFLFDYGDEWHFRVELIDIEPVDKLESYATVVKSVGEAFPQYEDPDDDDSDKDDE